ncbi:hypothetical protein DM02DRAFT_628152 [Periconia macrospinosa]|uniref:Uncharacterized protein n=1 Tax=Periconia macrospinosa TaxID=97972 RepID=A0A2V1DSE7_9PLEO|nr:hypothetical protein DM02DRAFT_628152 [Periconia macrospinosa]
MPPKRHTKNHEHTEKLCPAIEDRTLTNDQAYDILVIRRHRLIQQGIPNITPDQHAKAVRIFDDAVHIGIPEAANEGTPFSEVLKHAMVEIGRLLRDNPAWYMEEEKQLAHNNLGETRDRCAEKGDPESWFLHDSMEKDVLAEIEGDGSRAKRIQDIWRGVHQKLRTIDSQERAFVNYKLAPELKHQRTDLPPLSFIPPSTDPPIKITRNGPGSERQSLIIKIPLRISPAYFTSPAYADIRESFYHQYLSILKRRKGFVNPYEPFGWDGIRSPRKRKARRTNGQKGKAKKNAVVEEQKQNRDERDMEMSDISKKKKRETAYQSIAPGGGLRISGAGARASGFNTPLKSSKLRTLQIADEMDIVELSSTEEDEEEEEENEDEDEEIQDTSEGPEMDEQNQTYADTQMQEADVEAESEQEEPTSSSEEEDGVTEQKGNTTRASTTTSMPPDTDTDVDMDTEEDTPPLTDAQTGTNNDNDDDDDDDGNDWVTDVESETSSPAASTGSEKDDDDDTDSQSPKHNNNNNNNNPSHPSHPSHPHHQHSSSSGSTSSSSAGTTAYLTLGDLERDWRATYGL